MYSAVAPVEYATDKMFSIIQPPELESSKGRAIWETIAAAASGDAPALQRLLDREPGLSRAQYSYQHPIHFAARAGHLPCVRQLLKAGADPEWNGYHEGSLIEMARYRGYEDIARLLEEECRRRGRVAPGDDHPIHEAADADDVARVREFLDGDPALLNCGDRHGGSPLHRAVLGSARQVVTLLLNRGADIDALHSVARGAGGGWWAVDLQAIDLAIWGTNAYCPPKSDFETARMLLARGAAYDLTIAAALGDRHRIEALLDQDPKKVRDTRANGKRPLSTAIEFGHGAIARLLLDRGADPGWPELGAAEGGSLHAAARAGDRELVELLLARGADPNGDVDSGGNAVFAAKTSELRALLMAHGGRLDPYDLVWMGKDDEVMRLVTEDPASAERGCGGVFTAVVTRGNRKLLMRLLDAGVRVPAVDTGCRSYLLEDLEMLRILLAHGMNPDLPNWQGHTFLHDLCRGGRRGEAGDSLARAAILLDAGASISARDEEYSSTPLAWAARNNMPDMVEFLLARGAPISLPDDPPWAAPLAWAERRGHSEIVEILRKHRV
jgi:ankyrin repeat protein